MNKQITLKFLVVLVLVACTTKLGSQTTIGCGNAPANGALLDLKQDDLTLSNGVNSKKGLGLPRVMLINLDKLKMGENEILDQDDQYLKHTGLLVFNVNNCLSYQPNTNGLYVWDGSIWNPLVRQVATNPAVQTIIDSRDGQSYLVREFVASNGVSEGTWMLQNLNYNPQTHPHPNYLNYLHHNSSAYDKRFAYAGISKNATDKTKPDNWTKGMGMVYNWQATMNDGDSNTNDNSVNFEGNQGICPDGWYVPTESDYMRLFELIENNPELYSHSQYTAPGWVVGSDPSVQATCGTIIGTALKAECPLFNKNGKILDLPNGKSFTAEQGGFNILLLGDYKTAPQPINWGGDGTLWTSSNKIDAVRPSNRRAIRVVKSTSTVFPTSFGKDGMLPVRCKKL